MSTLDTHQLITEGHQALTRSDWEAARTSFARALAGVETAEAHEGLSWAAWWLNDGDGTIRARKAAYRLYRDAGDSLGAARMALWLSSDFEDFRGTIPISQGWRQRAGDCWRRSRSRRNTGGFPSWTRRPRS